MPECPSCHREVSETARFCPFCGAELQPGQAPGAGTQPTAGAVRPASEPPVLPPTAAGTPAAAAAFTPPAPPAKQQRVPGKKTWMYVAIVIGVIGLLVGGAVLGLGIATGVHYVRGPLDATNNYIRAVNDGDAATAYALLAPESPQRQNRTLQEFNTAVVQPQTDRLRTWRTGGVEFPYAGRPGRSRAEVTVTESFRTGETRDFRFLLEKVGSTWLISDYYVL